ncbi:MAG: hypothetical protein PHO56_03760 [Patescibacteria group bacterium]|nr:hypothetical protein [Patescibacteria group bacterium]
MKKIYILAVVVVILASLGFITRGYLIERKLRQEISICQLSSKQVVCDCPNCKTGDGKAASSTGVYFNEKYHYSINYFSYLNVDDFNQESVSFREPNGGPWDIDVSVNPGISVEQYLKNSGTKIEKKLVVNGNEMTIVSHMGSDKNENERFAVVEKQGVLFIIAVAYPEISDQIFSSFKFLANL